jgi:hypothetical protein
MEWIVGIVVAVMLALLAYAVLSTRTAVNEKVQPVVDSLDEMVHIFFSAKAPQQRSDKKPK